LLLSTYVSGGTGLAADGAVLWSLDAPVEEVSGVTGSGVTGSGATGSGLAIPVLWSSLVASLV
jgi:hypothetical protein